MIFFYCGSYFSNCYLLTPYFIFHMRDSVLVSGYVGMHLCGCHDNSRCLTLFSNVWYLPKFGCIRFSCSFYTFMRIMHTCISMLRNAFWNMMAFSRTQLCTILGQILEWKSPKFYLLTGITQESVRLLVCSLHLQWKIFPLLFLDLWAGSFYFFLWQFYEQFRGFYKEEINAE